MRETLDQDHSLSLSDPDRSMVLSHFLTNFLQNLASCHTAFTGIVLSKFRFNCNMYFGKYTYTMATMPFPVCGEYYSFIRSAFRVR
jgi:hypothetical protein